MRNISIFLLSIVAYTFVVSISYLIFLLILKDLFLTKFATLIITLSFSHVLNNIFKN